MAKTITINVSDDDEKILYNDLLKDVDGNEGIKDWVEKATTGKISNCWKRMHREWTTKLTDDETFTDPIPSNKAEFLALVLARPDYKDRTARDAG